jgi:hypothetical protein
MKKIIFLILVGCVLYSIFISNSWVSQMFWKLGGSIQETVSDFSPGKLQKNFQEVLPGKLQENFQEVSPKKIQENFQGKVSNVMNLGKSNANDCEKNNTCNNHGIDSVIPDVTGGMVEKFW